MPESDEELRLEEAHCLVRIARKPDDIDGATNLLSKGSVPLKDLNGIPDTRDQTPRSMSTLMLCNQRTDVLVATAAKISKTPDLQGRPKGAAAAISSLSLIQIEGQPAFRVDIEEEVGQPGHVSIRFEKQAAGLGDPQQRALRDSLLRTFGIVEAVADLRGTRCR